jgi:transcription initiation factor TFIIIB Brf1 subunit/transcription initiation factor TFIIB
MTLEEVCPECGGNVKLETVADWRDWVCVDCGRVIDSKNLKLEEQEAQEEEGNYEVEEL